MSEFIPHKRRMEEEYLQTTLRIKYNTIEILDQLATDLDMSRNELINQCIDYALENLKKPSNNEKEKQSVWQFWLLFFYKCYLYPNLPHWVDLCSKLGYIFIFIYV